MAYTEQEARALIIEAAHRLSEEKLIAHTWGNISARISDKEFIITPSGKACDTLCPEDLVKVNIRSGKSMGHYKPSSEKDLHMAAYRLRDNVDFVIHTHPFYASAVSADDMDALFAPCAAYGLPGSRKLQKSVARTIGDNPRNKAFLMARHGALCLGKDYDEALAVTEKLERQCKALFERRVSLENAPLDTPFSMSKLQDLPYVRWESNPFTLAWSRRHAPLRAYIDDFAQIMGGRIPVCKAKPRAAARLLKRYYAVVLSDHGAICTADTANAALVISTVLQKNCAAALYAENSRPLSMSDARRLGRFYQKQYVR